MRCGIPQPGENPNPSEITDVVRGEDIFFSRSVNSGPTFGRGSALPENDTGAPEYGPLRVQVRQYSRKPERWDDTQTDDFLKREAARPTQTTTADSVTVERRSLGLKAINGVMCFGMQTTKMTRRGKALNKQSVNYISEEWKSPIYGVMERITNDGDHHVQSHTMLQNFRLGEPDAKLFEVPHK